MGRASALLVLALAACSSTSGSKPASGSAEGSTRAKPVPAPAPAPAPAPPLPRPTMKASPAIDLADAAITKLRVMPFVSMERNGSASIEKGVFEIEWTSEKRYDAVTVCRIEAYNLAYSGMQDLNDSAKPNEHDALYRPDPFVIDPHVCELRFSDGKTIVARACYRDGALDAGACPAGTFPPPKLPEKMAIDVQGASLARTNGGGVQVKAMFTVGKALPDTKTSFSIVCDGIASQPDPGEGFVPLSRLLAGETLFTWQLSFFMKKPLTKLPTKCELTVTNKTTLGTFCIHEGSTEPGRCEP
ncbi:MAG TPA: hypothetical protein VLT45_02625 [Kofleriaceae bacterium]|nr:hypothetical protein [Kofleriaceae bacterium]